jgi:hypothetical protein
MGYLRCKMGKTDSVSSVMSGVANQYFQVLHTCFSLHWGFSRNNAATELGSRGRTRERCTRSFDLVEPQLHQKGRQLEYFFSQDPRKLRSKLDYVLGWIFEPICARTEILYEVSSFNHSFILSFCNAHNILNVFSSLCYRLWPTFQAYMTSSVLI